MSKSGQEFLRQQEEQQYRVLTQVEQPPFVQYPPGYTPKGVLDQLRVKHPEKVVPELISLKEEKNTMLFSLGWRQRKFNPYLYEQGTYILSFIEGTKEVVIWGNIGEPAEKFVGKLISDNPRLELCTIMKQIGVIKEGE